MKRHPLLKCIPVLCCTTLLWLCPAFGFSNDSSTLVRSVDQDLALTNTPITVTVVFTTGSLLDPLRGFFYAEQIPSGLEPLLLSVKLNGQSITNCTIESGQEGDVYPDYIPLRWVLELPPDFAQMNPVPEQGVVEIVYSITSTTSGAFSLQDYSWIGYDPVGTNVSFGHSEPGDEQIVIFITSDPPPSFYLSALSSTNGVIIGLIGTPGYSYVVEASTNLQDWSSIATNPSPFEFMENSQIDTRFYRAYHLQ